MNAKANPAIRVCSVRLPDGSAARSIELHRPAKRNCLSLAMLDQLLSALRESTDAVAVVLTGAGPSFCAGLDLQEIGGPEHANGNSARAHLERLGQIYAWLLHPPVPVIILAQGYAAGGGAGLVAAATQVLVSEGFRFKLPGGNLAPLASIAVPVFNLRAGERAACCLGREIPAAEALRLGLVDAVLPQESFDQCLSELANGRFPTRLPSPFPAQGATRERFEPRPSPSNVYVFNPLAEGYLAQGKAFNPVKHQARLAEDLANLPQFLCQPDDLVLVAKRPRPAFLASIQQAGFPLPEFVELRNGRIDGNDPVFRRPLGALRPWAWGPDSVRLLEPLSPRFPAGAQSAKGNFNDAIAGLYSKAWSADFLRKVLARSPEAPGWLCSEQEAGVVVETVDGALEAIDAIRRRGHHRIVVKEALGLAGQNALRLWEPEISPPQQRWLVRALKQGRQLVVEPWLERELDYSAQLEMTPRGLQLCGFTGLINDAKGGYLGNWAEPQCERCVPAQVTVLLGEGIESLYREIFSWLEAELRSAGFFGPVGIDAFVYRTPDGSYRLKPVVEINPRYTMGRLTVELMKQVSPGRTGRFRLVTLSQARAAGFTDLSGYAHSLTGRLPLCLDRASEPKIRAGALCLNDPGQAQVCLATFEVSPLVEES